MESQELVPNEIFTISDFLSPQECQEYIALSETIGYSEAPINTRNGAEVRSDIRTNSRAMLDDLERAESLWQRLAVFVPAQIEGCSAIGLNERLRFYRYDPGQKFAWHYDGVYWRKNGDFSIITFMVYLNDNITLPEPGSLRRAAGRNTDNHNP